MGKKSLADIVRGRDFIRELDRAAAISQEIQGEAHFLVYSTAKNEICINEAIPGFRVLNPLNENIPESELTDDHYDWVSPEDSHPGFQHEPNKGGYIQTYSTTLIRVHFHPPRGSAIPSPGDLATLNESRKQNDNIVELCSSNQDRFVDYVNPIEIVGHAAGPGPYELFVCQEAPKKPISFWKFMDSVAVRLTEKSGEDKDPLIISRIGFNYERKHFRDAAEFVKFVNESGFYRAQLLRVGEDYSALDEMSMFQPGFIRREYLEMD